MTGDYQCDFCHEWLTLEEVKRVLNPYLYGKDVLYFCNDNDCEENFFEQGRTNSIERP